MNELELINQKSLDVVAIFTKQGELDETLKKIESSVLSIVPDTSTAKGRKEIASLAYKVAQSKTLLDGLGKDLVADWKNRSKLVDESRKYARDFLDTLKDKVREPLTEWEKAEAEREAKEQAEKQYQADWDLAIVDNLMFDRLKELERKEAELAKLKAETEAKERARLEEEAKKKAEAERIEREARIAQDAKEKAEHEAQAKINRERIEAAERIAIEKRDAEQRAIAAEQKRIADIAAEKERATRAMIEAEQKRLADIQAEKDKAEAEKRAMIEAQAKKDREAEESRLKERARIAAEKAVEEARQKNLNHRKKINNEAAQSLIEVGFGKEAAKNIIVAIASGKVSHITINY